jgi:signal transduction histidine kinase
MTQDSGLPAGAGATAFPSWLHLVRSAAYTVPGEHLAGFKRAIAFANWQRTGLFAAVVAGSNVLVGLIPSLWIWSHATGNVRSIYAVEIGWHLFLVLFGTAMFVWSRRDHPSREADAQPRHQTLSLLFCTVMLTAMMAFSVFKHPLTHGVTMYLIGVAAVGMLFYLPPRFAALLYTVTFAGLVTGLSTLHPEPFQTWLHAGQCLVAVLLFWVGSRFMYVLKALNYVQLAELTRQAKQLAEANRELERAHRFKTDLLAAAAHDLRDPLNTIALSAQTLRDELHADAGAYPLVLAINERARHMGEFIANLLTDAASPNHEITLQRTPVLLPEFVANLVAHCRSGAVAKDIELYFDADEAARKAPAAAIDPVRFRQVVENMLTNAIKYSPTGKDVWVTLSYDPRSGHRLTVRDEGLGLTADDQKHLFEKYQRLSAHPTAGERSTGLGLAIVKQLVELHGGRVRAESPGPGQGSTFIVTVP